MLRFIPITNHRADRSVSGPTEREDQTDWSCWSPVSTDQLVSRSHLHRSDGPPVPPAGYAAWPHALYAFRIGDTRVMMDSYCRTVSARGDLSVLRHGMGLRRV